METGKITLEQGDFGTYLIVSDGGADRLVQTDWDYPGVASSFGWSPSSPSLTAGEEISEAGEYLDDHIGDTVEDPGYF